MNKTYKGIIFLDRDGVLNEEIGDYVYKPADFKIKEEVVSGLKLLKALNYGLVIVTNQGGIAKGLYTEKEVLALYDILQKACDNIIDAHYFAPLHPSVSESLMRKPNSLMLEKGLAKFKASTAHSFLIGDAARDLEAAHKLGIKAILLPTLKEKEHHLACFVANDFLHAVNYIIKNTEIKFDDILV